MLHCPYCGSGVKENELYCITCGKELPDDLNHRLEVKKRLNRLWYIPIITVIILFISTSILYLYLQNQSSQAKEYYEQGEKFLANSEYEEAREYFKSALQRKQNFAQAENALSFVDDATTVKKAISAADSELEKENFQEALSVLDDAERSLKNYDGSAVNNLVDELILHRNEIKVEQLKSILSQNPTIDELKTLLWEADAIKQNEAEKIVESIRNQIIDFTFSKASEHVSNKQFTDAQTIVEDGLKYAPESEKLGSLKTTIEKEKLSFEVTQEQRIEQAINVEAEEREINETDAIELVSVKIETDQQGNIVVKGEVKSIASDPVNSVLVDYSLLDNNENEFLSNEVYVYPDTLYPQETGKFEFTHYDIQEDIEKIDIDVNTITWYLNY
ncbi:zinc ribbon domain-containing protein [Ornithinibacillus sp. L9]|uniref:Zinc ribbon domain-containing protein n=1 Tax=Ornithinibacillus caprae TaxID=2678566 RepID=A0A6N8FLA2_9BACI|nr:zinc ribbon domain-containing protein [Ornithinibacillus caprae]MUK90245.1 zinc ribbon domain-containing protein [Ornithinibacillus caprae]